MATNFWSNLFGWSSGKTDKFMEYLNRNRSEIWGNKEPQWIDTNKPYYHDVFRCSEIS